MSEGIRAQIIGYCEAVETGSKPAALMSIQIDQLTQWQ